MLMYATPLFPINRDQSGPPKRRLISVINVIHMERRDTTSMRWLRQDVDILITLTCLYTGIY